MTNIDTPAPIVQQMAPSPQQRPAVLARGRDVAVTAGAGTGKTRTLVARYLSLLADGLDLRSVVAITFTKKAAREMRNRVREEVRRYIAAGDLGAAALHRWRDIYTELDAARIGTIHSLCGEILRHHPAEAGLDPRFEMLDEGRMALLQAQVVDETLGWASDQALTAPLFALLGESDVRSLLGMLLNRQLDVIEMWETLPDLETPGADETLLARWRRSLDRYRARKLDELLGHPDFVAGAAVIRQVHPLDADDRMAEHWVVARDALAAADWAAGRPVAQIEALAALDTIDLRGGRQAAWPGGKEGVREVKDALGALRDRWREGADDLTLVLTEMDETLAHHYSALRALFDRAVRRYASMKAERHALDFDDLEGRALRLLREDAQARAYWQSEVQALLVDEFQDTNQRQFELLSLFNGEGGKLFTVGDAKQSIYRFRGADVTVFRERTRNADGVAASLSSARTLSLTTSYRAHRALIEQLNALLRPVLGAEEDPARPYVEPFAPLTHHREPPAPGVQPPFVELHLAVGAKTDGALDRAAAAVVARLVELVERGAVVLEDVPLEGGARGARGLDYGDIAILCRASTSFEAYENALEAAGVPFLTVAGRGFYGRPEVRDVLNALQVIADPTDDLALAGLLRSPVCGLSDMALVRLVQARDAEDDEPLWAILSGGDLAFLDDEAPRAVEVRDLIRRLHAMAGRVAVADVLKALLDETVYRAALYRADQARGVYNLDKLLTDAHTSEMVSLGAFLDYVRQLRDVGVREGEARTLASGAVQVMTVHASKGLEFPVVVLGDAARQPPQVRGPLIDPDNGVVLPLKDEVVETDEQGQHTVREVSSSIYQLVRAKEQDQDAAEGDRLLYVAATRAREMVLISASVRGRPSGWLARLATALDLDDLHDGEGDGIRTLDLALGEGTARCTIYPEDAEVSGVKRDRTAENVPGDSGALPPERLPLLDPWMPDAVRMDEAAVEATRDPPQRVWQVVPVASQTGSLQTGRPSAPAWVVGQIVHGALAQWHFPAAVVGRTAGGGDGAFDAWAVAEARGYGITDDAEIGDAVRRAARMLGRFQTTDLYDRMSAATRRLHEVPYSLLREGVLETGVMDALFEDGHGWTLVEFKTDYVAGAGRLEALLAQEDYVDQVARYVTAVEPVLGERPEPVLCFLNYGGVVRLVTGRW